MLFGIWTLMLGSGPPWKNRPFRICGCDQNLCATYTKCVCYRKQFGEDVEDWALHFWETSGQDQKWMSDERFDAVADDVDAVADTVFDDEKRPRHGVAFSLTIAVLL